MSDFGIYLVLMILCGIKADVTKSPVLSVCFNILSVIFAAIGTLEMLT